MPEQELIEDDLAGLRPEDFIEDDLAGLRPEDFLDPNDKLDQFSYKDNSGVNAPRNTSQALLSREIGFNNGVSSADMFGTIPIEPRDFTFGQAERGLKRFSVDIIKAVGHGSTQFGERLVEPTLIDKLINKEDITFNDVRNYLKTGHDLESFLRIFGNQEELSEKAIAWGAKVKRITDEFMVDQGLAMTEGEEPTFMFHLGSGLGSLGSALGLAVVTRSPAAAAAFFAALQQTSIYDEARASGKDVNDSVFYADLASIPEGMLEQIGLKLLYRAGKLSLLKAIAASSVIEGFQEISQTSAELTITELADIRKTTAQQALKQLWQSGAIGFLLGGGVGSVSGGITAVTPTEAPIDTSAGPAFDTVTDESFGNIVSTDSEGNTTITQGSFADVEGTTTKEQFDALVGWDFTEAELDAIGSGEIGNLFTESFLDEVIENLGPELDIDADSKQDTPGLAVSGDTKTMKEKSAEIMDAMIKGIDISEAFTSEEELAEFRAKQLEAFDRSMEKGAEVVREGKLFALEETERALLNQIDDLIAEGEVAFTEFADKLAETEVVEEEVYDPSLSEDQIAELKRQGEEELKADQLAQFEQTKKYQSIEKKADKLEASLLKTQEEINTLSQIGSDEVLDELRGQRANVKVGIAIAVKGNKELQKVIDKAAKLGGKIAEEERAIVQKEFKNIVDELGNTISKDANIRFLGRGYNIRNVKQLNKAVAKLMVDANININKTAKTKAKKAIEDLLTKKAGKQKRMHFTAQDAVNDMSKFTDKNAADNILKSPPKVRNDTWSELRMQYLNLLNDKNSDAKSWIVLQDNIVSAMATGKTRFEKAANDRKVEEAKRKMKAPRAIQIRDNEVTRGKIKETSSDLMTKVILTQQTTLERAGLGGTIVTEGIQHDMDYRGAMHRIKLGLEKVLNNIDKRYKKRLVYNTKPSIIIVTRNGNEMTLNEGQAIQLYAYLQNKELNDSLTEEKPDNVTEEEYKEKWMGITEDNIATIENYIRDEGKALATEMFRLYDESYYELNKVYREIYGVSLPRTQDYSALHREAKDGDNNDAIDISEKAAGSLEFLPVREDINTPGALKERVKNQRRIRTPHILDNYIKYSMDTQWWINYRQWYAESEAILVDPLIKQKIIDAVGKKEYKALKDQIDLYRQSSRSWAKESESYVMLDILRRNAVIGQLYLNPNMILKQASSAVTALQTVPVKDFVKSTLYFASHVNEVTNLLKEHDSYLLRGVNSQVDLMVRQEGTAADFLSNSKIDAISEFTGLNIVWGDKAGFGISVYADYSYRHNVLGESHEHALNEAMKTGESTQQSGLPSQNTMLQKTGGSISRLATMYTSSGNALLNSELRAVAQHKNGEITKARMFRKIGVTHIVGHLLFSLISSAGDTDPEDILAAMIAGPWGSVPLLGDLWTLLSNITAAAIVGAVTDDDEVKAKIWHPEGIGMNPLTNIGMEGINIWKTASDVLDSDEEVSSQEMLEAAVDMLQWIVPLPISKATSMTEGALGIGRDGEQLEGIDQWLKTMGYSDYTIENRDGDDKSIDYSSGREF